MKGLVASSGSKLAACKDLVIHGGRLRRWMVGMEDWKQFTKRKVFTGDFWHPFIPRKHINQPHLPYQNKILLRHLQATCSRAFKLPSTAFYDTTLLIYRRASNKNQELFLMNLYRQEHCIKIRKFTPSHINSIYARAITIHGSLGLWSWPTDYLRPFCGKVSCEACIKYKFFISSFYVNGNGHLAH